jgi:outer membrane lipoprotein-sorting protein
MNNQRQICTKQGKTFPRRAVKHQARVAVRAIVAGALVLFAWAALSAELTGRQVLDRTLSIHQGIKDYVCRVRVKTNFPNVRVPERHLKVFAKLPDKLRVESGGEIVIVPRDALLLGNLRKHVTENTRVVLVAQGSQGGRPLYSVKILPTAQGRQERLVAWVWGDTWTLKRTEVWVARNRILAADWTHARVGRYWLPARIFVTVEGGEVAQGGKGTVELVFSDWQVNVGLDDKIFAEQTPPAPQRRFRHPPGAGRRLGSPGQP